ncbi:short-chain dehydrogenase/reductase SDR [Mrakia frigida]|uniref:SDR family oxidoreductase n=1 Tax=Mrakia frigida TaxID=29902 RepID=UPI003FCC1D1B
MSKVCIVTGASSGIGRASSVALYRAGHRVVLSGRRAPQLEETADLCKKEGSSGDTLVVTSDINTVEGVKTLFVETIKKFGRVDMVFNNAGQGSSAVPVEDVPLSTFDLVMSVDVRAAFMITQEAVRQMKSQIPQGGRIINNGSISAHVPRVQSTPYTMAKHAISGLTKCTQLDGRKFNIACSQVDVGNATTNMGGKGDPRKQASGHLLVEPSFPASDVGDVIVYITSLPLTTNIATLTIMATNMPYVGRG